MVWINEFHYDNAGADTGEFVEIAGAAGTDLTGWTVVLYNGSNGQSYAPLIALGGTIPDQQNGFGTRSFAAVGLQNGAPDGLALVNAAGTVVEFISYEGSFTATNGPATGMISTDVGVGIVEPGNASDTSIGRVGEGDEVGDFSWAVIADDTPDAVNAGQSFGGGALPTLSIDDVAVDEGDSGTVNAVFTVTLSAPSTGTVTVAYASSDRSAEAGSDYEAVSGTLTFAPGTTSQTVSVPITGDTSLEGHEAFAITLSAPVGATLGDSEGLGLIVNDDEAPPPPPAAVPWINEFHYDNGGTDTGEFVEIAGAAGLDLSGYSIVLYNGNGGVTYGTPVALSGIIPDQQNGYGTVSVGYPANGIQNGGAGAAGEPDGIALVGPGGVVEFISYEGVITAANGPAVGMTSVDVGVFETGGARGTSIGRTGSGNEASDFAWALIGDDTPGGVNAGQTFVPPVPQLRVSDVEIAEGTGGTTTATFTITRSGAAGAFSVAFATADGTALAGSDYAARAGVLNFAAGQNEATVTVDIVGDSAAETDETFFLNLSGATDGAVIADGQGQATIANDDAEPPAVTIDGVTQAEGDAGTTAFTFTITRSGGTGAFSVDYVATGGTATAGEDYAAAAGTLAFAAGETSKTVTIQVNGDTIAEGRETFEVRLFNPTAGAVIADPAGTGTIVNDDIVRIHDVQGDAFFSPVLAADGINNFNIPSASEVTVRAVVTAIDDVGPRQGFYITEEVSDWDGNILTSEGIFVMTRDDRNNGSTLSAAAPDLKVGDLVTVAASVIEYQVFSNMPRTMLSNPSAIVIGGSGFELPTLVLDGSPGRRISNSILTDEVPDHRDSKEDAADTFDPENDALDYFETIEGMLVTVPDMVVADGFVDTSGGDPFLKAYSSVHADADQINDRGGYTIAGEGTLRGGRHVHDGDTNPDILELDFTDFAVDAPAGLTDAASMGDRLGDVTGVIEFDFTDLKLVVTEPLAPLVDTQPEREVTGLGGDARSLTVATFNVENLDAADPQSRFDDIAGAIAANLSAPDIISIEEIQDNNGAAAGDGISSTGTDASATWDKLVAALNAATGERYQWVDELPAYNAEGGEPRGNIRVGFLYNTNRVQLGDLAADATIAERRAYTDRIGDGTRDAGDLIAFDDSQIAGEIVAADWTNTRKSLLGEFVFNGNTVYVTANHWPSKGGSGQFWQFNQNLDAGQPQNRDWDQRSEIAEDVYAMLDRIQTASGSNRIVAGGDFNDFYFYRPLQVVTGEVMADGTARVGGSRFDNLTVTELTEAERYTYAFDGRSQAIDHIIVDRQLSAVASYDVVHINTGYNSMGGVNPALSDHDPGLAQFDFRDFAEVLRGSPGDELIDGFGGDDTLVYAGPRSDYRVTLNAAGDIVVAGADGTDTVRSVEALVFGGERFDDLANAAPVAADDAAAVDEDATSDNLWQTLLANDSDVDFFDDTLSISAVDTSATKGSVIFDAETQTLRYVADDDSFDALLPGQTVTDRFSYTVSDGQGGTDTASVEVTVTGRFDTEFRFGGNRDDTLIAGAGEDFLYGGNGNDALHGLGGHDFLFGDNGNDGLFGGDGNDWLFGGNGEDELDGGAGNDRLFGGNGNDRLTGGGGEDVFVVGRGGGRDQVTDFETASDSLFLERGVRVSKSRVEDVNGDGVLDLNVSFSGGGGSVALLGVTDIDAVDFTGSPSALGVRDLFAGVEALIL